MTSITPTPYDDKHDNMRAIEYAIGREIYKKLFNYLDVFFKNKSSVTAKEVQIKFFLPDYPRAFQLLDSFVVLNLLKKIKKPGRKQRFFVQINQQFWKEAKHNLVKKKRTDDGSK